MSNLICLFYKYNSSCIKSSIAALKKQGCKPGCKSTFIFFNRYLVLNFKILNIKKTFNDFLTLRFRAENRIARLEEKVSSFFSLNILRFITIIFHLDVFINLICFLFRLTNLSKRPCLHRSRQS